MSTAQSRNKPLRTIDTSDSEDSEAGTWFWHMSANESESESDEGGQSDEDEPDFEPRTEAAVPLQPVSKEICWNKEGENNLRGIYGKRSVSSARRQKLAAIHSNNSFNFGKAGDSGAAILDKFGTLVGLYFAGNDYTGSSYFSAAKDLLSDIKRMTSAEEVDLLPIL